MSPRLILLLCIINIALVLTQSELTFLGEVELIRVPKVQAVPEVIVDSVQFAAGFNKGLTFFAGLPHQDECESESQNLAEDLVAIFKLFKNISKDTNFPQFVEDLAARLLDAYQEVNDGKKNCSSWRLDAKNVINGLVAYVSKETYVALLTVHTIYNMALIKSNIDAGVKLIQDGNFLDAGNAFGETVKLALFWDFKN